MKSLHHFSVNVSGKINSLPVDNSVQALDMESTFLNANKDSGAANKGKPRIRIRKLSRMHVARAHAP